MAAFKKLLFDLNSQSKEKENLQKKLIDLKDKLKMKDLNRDDPFTFTHLIEEVKNLKKQIDNIDVQSDKLIQQINFLRNKHGGVDVDKKLDQFKL